MSQSKVQKITVRNKKGTEGKITVGGNTEVLLDGVPVRGARFVKIEVDARKVAKVTLELFAEVEVEANVVLAETVKGTDLVSSKGKPIVRRCLSSYAPEAIDHKKT